MNHAAYSADRQQRRPFLNRIALAATLYCLSGCAIGEIAGMTIGAALSWRNAQTIALAFAGGCFSTMLPLLRAGYKKASALRVALTADTASIAIMEAADNLSMLLIPGAMAAPLTSPLF